MKKLVTLLMLVVVLLSIVTEANAKKKKRGPSVLASRSGMASWHDYSSDGTVKRHYRRANITASREFACGTRLKVTNVKNGKSVIVTVRDWGPAKWTGRNLDLNKPAFKKIAPLGSGQVKVRFVVLKRGNCKTHRH
jgi:rare lipoprotein A